MARPYSDPEARLAVADLEAAVALLSAAGDRAGRAHSLVEDHELAPDEPGCPPDAIATALVAARAQLLAVRNAIGLRAAPGEG